MKKRNEISESLCKKQKGTNNMGKHGYNKQENNDNNNDNNTNKNKNIEISSSFVYLLLLENLHQVLELLI